jgi:hypothetical protein
MAFPYVGLEIRVRDVDQCKSMADLALAKGCIAEESVFAPGFPTPLFTICLMIPKNLKVTELQVAETIQQLLNAGYNKEYRNSEGQTPLLYAASHYRWMSLTIMRLLLAKGADLHVVDEKRRTALHLSLSFTRPARDCRHLTKPRHEQAIAKGINGARPYDNDNAEEDAYSNEVQSDQEAEDGAVEYASDASCNSAGSPQGQCFYEDDAWTEKILYYYCEVRDIDDFKLPPNTSCDNELHCEPQPWMFKARLRLKLLALMQAGCDPNALDANGLSATHYATLCKLMPQWEWALANSGWNYNEQLDKCERQDSGTCGDRDPLP